MVRRIARRIVFSFIAVLLKMPYQTAPAWRQPLGAPPRHSATVYRLEGGAPRLPRTNKVVYGALRGKTGV